MNRRVQSVLMLLLGGAILRIAITGSYQRYVKHGLRPLLLLAGAFLVIMAVLTLWYEIRVRHPGGHSHEPGVGWLLLLPALVLLTLSPPALSSFAAAKAGTVVVSSQSDYPPLPPGNPAPVKLLDYSARAIYDSGRSLTGRTVRLDGFVTPGPGGHPVLARIVLTCCAADGRPVKVGLDGKAPTGLPTGTWIQADGVYSTRTGNDPINKAKIPYLTVTAWQEIPTPQDPYD
ncbi:TIGR03943 family protein [Actinoplanes sp. TBRC 11911]|uniref:TIGR03943 family putative permease subunit n=1 Tax=Actinoplanes sp. TBRC 11911 TaxID=2729386 RepID=UPI00145DF7D9|nr:TIGR03943 family protein [Actinoplanes sp. TBRC 11911]NMO53927.1 TIGR03943 family protein [Actinoplanes sp. TBRC 11911]